MSDFLYFIAKNFRAWLIEHIHFCVGRHAERIIEDTIESIHSVPLQNLPVGVPTLIDLAGVPSFRVVK